MGGGGGNSCTLEFIVGNGGIGFPSSHARWEANMYTIRAERVSFLEIHRHIAINLWPAVTA